MQEFFEEQEQFNRKYYDVFLLSHLAASNERLEKTEQSERSAVVTTRIDGGTHYVRLRYDLRAEGESWIIENRRMQCSRCGGTGRKAGTEEPCPGCKGEGWLL